MESKLDGPRDGTTFDPTRDMARLNKQARDVATVMIDGRWRSLRELSDATGHPEASVSARLRDLRKTRFGAHVVERQNMGGGLWNYRLMWRHDDSD